MTVPIIDANPRREASVRRKLVDGYKQVVLDLSDQITEWATSLPDWSVTSERLRQDISLTGRRVFVPKNTIDTPKGRLVLEPSGISVSKNAIVDFSAWPSSYHVRLLHDLTEQGTWHVRTESGIFLRQPWNCENFLQLAQDLLAADWE